MDSLSKTIIKVQTTINAPVRKVWKNWTTPADIMKWNQASDDWHTTSSENDLKVGGKFISHMEAKDGSFGFDFWGVYDSIKVDEHIESTLGDGRKVKVTFAEKDETTEVIETFEAENTNSIELQKAGWQSILDNFKKFVEES